MDASQTGDVGTVIAAARSQLGVPYKWGFEKPGVGFDCSGLTQWAYAQAGIKIPRTTVTQVGQGTKVSKDQLQPGDLVFPELPIHHVQIYTGNGNIIESPQSGETVTERPMWGFYTARRIVNNNGAASDVQNFGAGDVAGAATGMLIPGLPSFSALFSNARHLAMRAVEVTLGIILVIVAAAEIGMPVAEKVMNGPVGKVIK
jgi:NlpC/P60 family